MSYSPAGKPLAFDPRSNTPSGGPHHQPDSKRTGASQVSKVMLRQEKEQGTSSGMKFRIEDGNHAKKINMDAPPK
jgi:hypothetical protein